MKQNAGPITGDINEWSQIQHLCQSPSVLQRLSGVKHEHHSGKGLSNWDLRIRSSQPASLMHCLMLRLADGFVQNSELGDPQKKATQKLMSFSARS